MVYHLEHERSPNSWFTNPHMDQNNNEWEKVQKMNSETLRKYITSQVSENKNIYLPPRNFFSKIIASLVNSFLSPSPGIEPKHVSERLKELRKIKAYLVPPSRDLNF